MPPPRPVVVPGPFPFSALRVVPHDTHARLPQQQVVVVASTPAVAAAAVASCVAAAATAAASSACEKCVLGTTDRM